MKYSVKFGLNRRTQGDEPCAIRARVSWCCVRADLAVGFSIEPSRWDDARSLATAANGYGESADAINAAVIRVRSVVADIFSRFDLLEHRAPSLDELRTSFAVAMGRVAVTERTLFDVFDEFVSSQGRLNGWSDSTYKKMATIRTHLLAACPSLTFAQLETSSAPLEHLVLYMQRAGIRNTTVDKYLGDLRWFLRWASKAGYYSGSLGTDFRPRLRGSSEVKNEIIYLEWDELMHLYSMPLSGHLASVRDVFCFCCFTGLRYSDVAALRRTDVSDDCIRIVTRKTADSLTIELNRYSRAILDRWSTASLPKGAVLPVISNQKMNAYLKELGDEAGLCSRVRLVWYRGSQRMERVAMKRELLTTHCGRRTFVVHALRLGIPAEVIMRWTGHSGFEAMRPYMRIVDKAKQEAMSRFDSADDPQP